MSDKHHGVGPHPQPWPTDPHYDTELLAAGDTRNVLDRYRYWSVDAIRTDLAAVRTTLHIAIENLEHDLNIGSIVRTANAFNVASVSIIGRRHWNKRGAMVTDKYIEVNHYPDAASFAAAMEGRAIIGIDNFDGALPLAATDLPADCVLVFGSEQQGISDELRASAHSLVYIEQSGSTRSLNVGAAAAIAMYAWQTQHVLG